MVMDIVVADILLKYGMLLSRSQGDKLKGNLQLDMSYATIPIFGQQKRLYRETLMKYMVNSQENIHNYPLYFVHSGLDSFILYNNGDLDSQIAKLEDDAPGLQESKAITKESKTVTTEIDEPTKYLWSMDFDGAVSKEGSGAGVWLHNHKARYSESHSYKLNFQCTNNIVEYEALMLGLKLLKKLGAKNIMVRGDSKLVIKQIKGEY
jgi:hypothetical protein